jgi:hypothetical protein
MLEVADNLAMRRGHFEAEWNASVRSRRCALRFHREAYRSLRLRGTTCAASPFLGNRGVSPMPNDGFRLPGFSQPLENPQAFVSGVLRSFGAAAQALGYATDRLVLRLAEPRNGGAPDYQIQTVDGEDAAAFSGGNHDFLYEDITVRLDEEKLQDQFYSSNDVENWLNALNGEGAEGGPLTPGLAAGWTEGDRSDPRD